MRHILSVLAYVVATFAVQAASHFGVNADHYAAVSFMRAEPILALGVLSMVIQGAVFAYLYSLRRMGGIAAAIRFAWLCGAVVVSYPALAEPGKYAVPSAGSWALVEIIAGFAQFTLFGVLLGLIHRNRGADGSDALR